MKTRPGHAAGSGNERGAASIMVAFLMVALLGFTALVVDVGFLYAERTQLQSGADAASLGVAQSCAKDPASANCSITSPLALDLANKNALDGLAHVQSIAFGTVTSGAKKVTVVTGSQEAGGEANKVSLFFANIFGMKSTEVGSSASAQWGSPVAGETAFPITVSICQVRDTIGQPQLLQLHGNHKNTDCNYGPSGQFVEGGFGGLTDEGTCAAIVDIYNAESGSDVGSNPPSNCQTRLTTWASEINAGRPVTVLLPVFDEVTGTGSGAVYGMKTFAAFELMGWKLSGGNTLPYTFRNRTPDVPAELECRESNGCRGIIGKFVKYVSLDTRFTIGKQDIDGTTVVGMAG